MQEFADVWHQAACPIELKKQIVRSVIEEVLVDEQPRGRLSFIVHWKGGSHTAFEMEKVSPKTVHRTADADLDVISEDGATLTAMTRSRESSPSSGGGPERASPGASSPSRPHAAITASTDALAPWWTKTC